MDRESKLEAARRKLRKFQAKRSKPSDDDAVNTSFHTSDLLSPENLNADGVPYSPTASPDRPDTLTDDQSHVMVEATPIQTSMMGGLVGAQNAHTGIGSPVYLMRHTEKRTIRTKSSNPAMSDIQEKKAQSERIAASVTAGIAQEIMMYERHLQSTSPNSSARSSITSLQITSSQDLSSQQITKAFNDTNTSFHPDAYISDLQDQLARRNAQITMLRNMVAGSADLFQYDLDMQQDAMSEVEGDPTLLKAWLHQLRCRVRDLEQGKDINEPDVSSFDLRRSVGSLSNPRKSVTQRATQWVQTDDTDISDAIGAMESEVDTLSRQLREKDLAMRLLADDNARLQVSLLEIRHINTISVDTASGSADAEVVQSLRDRCENLASELEASLDERDRDRVLFATKEQELIRSNATIAHRLRELEALHKAACDRRDILQREVNNLKASKKSTSNNSEGLGRKVEVLTRNMEAANRENRELAHENRELRARLEAVEADTVAKRLQTELEVARGSIQMLGEGNSKLQSELAELKEGGASHWREERLRFQEEMARLRDAVVSTGGNEGKLRVEVEELKGLLEGSASEKENLRLDKVKLLRETEGLRVDKNHLIERSTELEKRLRMLERATNEEVEAWRKALREENDSLKEEKIKLTRELELFKARHVELESKVKKLKKELEDAPSQDELSKLAHAVKEITLEKDALQKSFEAAQSSLDGLRSELNNSKKEYDSLSERLARQPAATPISDDRSLEQAAMTELVATLRLQCDELAKQAQSWKQESEATKESLETYKKSGPVDEATREQMTEIENQLTLASDRLKRERETWKLKEQTLYKEIERIHMDYMGLTKEMGTIRKLILESRMTAGGLSQNIVKPEEVSVQAWVLNIISAYKKQQNDLVEAHTILDLQHEKLEDAIARSSMSIDFTRADAIVDRDTVVPPGYVTVADQSVQTEPISRLGSVKAALSRSASGISALATSSGMRSRSPSVSSSTAAQRASDPKTDRDAATDPLPAEEPRSEQLETLHAALTKLTHKYVTLQQQHSAIASQLDHQLRANAEIKRLIVGSAIASAPSPRGKGDVDELVLEKYNDAMLEIGSLRTEMERWRLRCEEAEDVVEQVFLRQMSTVEEDLEGEGCGEVNEKNGLERGRTAVANSEA